MRPRRIVPLPIRFAVRSDPQGDQVWGRPVHTRQMKDGSLLIADDYAGAIYRVTCRP